VGASDDRGRERGREEGKERRRARAARLGVKRKPVLFACSLPDREGMRKGRREGRKASTE